MVWLVIALAAVALALAVVAIVTARRLRVARAATVAAEQRADQQATELTATTGARDEAEQARADAIARAEAAEARRDELEAEVTELTARASEAERRSVAADTELDAARHEVGVAAAARADAEDRVVALERRIEEMAARAALEDAAASAASAAPPVSGELDAQLVWALERARSERTWRQSVAVGPDGSAFSTESDPLIDALQIELDAAREEVGAVVELDADVPAGVTAAGSVLALKATQELLASVVRRGETTTVRVRADGADLVIDVESVDEDGHRIDTGPLPIPPSATVDVTPGGVRIREAVAAPLG
jgi:hypothetical protein